MKTPELQTSVEGHSLDAVVRPAWDDLCLCVTVHVTVSKQRPKESCHSYKQRVMQTIRSAYEHGAEWMYDADCPLCESGVSGPNDQDQAPQGSGA